MRKLQMGLIFDNLTGEKLLLHSRTRLTADKREIKDFPKLALATSFIRKTLGEIAGKKNVERE